MFSFLRSQSPVTALVGPVPVTVNPKETLLLAALRQGIDFPHSCRVGGCATCKCRLLEGRVKELTRFSYVLSADELQQGYILACQSVPLTDITVEVPESRQIAGRVVGQQRLTHDIARLDVQLDTALQYKAGQYASIALDGIDGPPRSYSFATPPRPDGLVSFFVKRLAGGAFSTRINEGDVQGAEVTLAAPLGDFWLRPGDAPLLMVAGGSGLAPILAMLEEAVQAGDTRPATLLFGARTQRDLYALDDIASIARRWRGEFRFVPVLSAAQDDGDWPGERGMVSDVVERMAGAGGSGEVQAYLCGPPPMVDACEAALVASGVAEAGIYADRFTTADSIPKRPA